MGAVAVKPVRDVMKAIQPIIDEAGAYCRIENGTGHHPKLVVEYNGRSMQTQLSTSPRVTGNAIKYKISDVKRILRELGAGKDLEA
jgi:hypothetical protein